jgi:DNA-binding protein YbaB
LGIFDFFGAKGGSKASLRKQAQKVTEKYGPPENRQKVIEQLGAMGTPEALSVLCLRFTIRADPGITDDEEKETVRDILVEAGEKAVAPVKEFLEAQESGISHGLRVLAAVRPSEDVIATVLALLHRLGREYSRDPEKKVVLLSWLAEHGGDLAGAPDLETSLLPLLEDFSDDVRIAAVRVVAHEPLGEKARVALLELFARDRDNARVRGEVLQALADVGADVKGFRPTFEELIGEPFFLDKDGRVKKRG